MNYSEDRRKERKQFTVEAIQRDKKEIAVDVAILAGSAMVIGIGALGLYFLGPDVINNFINYIFKGEPLTLKSDFMLKLKVAGVELSGIGIGVGIAGIVKSIKDIKKNVKNISYRKETLNKLDDSKGRTINGN